MNKGYLMPIAHVVPSQFTEEVEFRTITVIGCKQKSVVKQKDGQCCLCGKTIFKNERCLFAHMRLTKEPERHCGRTDLLVNTWWHPECEKLSIEDRTQILRDGMKSGKLITYETDGEL